MWIIEMGSEDRQRGWENCGFETLSDHHHISKEDKVIFKNEETSEMCHKVEFNKIKWNAIKNWKCWIF
jgi:hypothetical protein